MESAKPPWSFGAVCAEPALVSLHVSPCGKAARRAETQAAFEVGFFATTAAAHGQLHLCRCLSALSSKYFYIKNVKRSGNFDGKPCLTGRLGMGPCAELTEVSNEGSQPEAFRTSLVRWPWLEKTECPTVSRNLH